MADNVEVQLGQRRHEDIALDLMEWIAGRTGGYKTEKEILELYAECKSAIYAAIRR
jgi:hypothetical protein